jgi:hypothetical protein
MNNPLEHNDELAAVLAQLKPLEPIIYAANDGRTRAYFEHLLAPDFCDIGASGRIYARHEVLAVLEGRQRNPYAEAWTTRDHQLRKIADRHYLITYTLQQPTRTSVRTALWRQTEGGWQMVFHQGTVVLP